MERRTLRRNIFSMLLALGLSSSEIQVTKDTGVLPVVMREAIYYSIYPYIYMKDLSGVDGYKESFSIWKIKRKIEELRIAKKTGEHYVLSQASSESQKRKNMNRLDAWRIYLGLPQLYNTFTFSNFKPQQSYKEVKYFKIRNFLRNILNDEIRLDYRYSFKPKDEAEIIRYFYQKIFDERNKDRERKFFVHKDEESGVMGDFKISFGEDSRGTYISYYDRWDLKGDPIEGVNGTFGTPFEIYDRIYFDPKTFEPINVK